MADQVKRGGFHALEQRIHQIEEEDAKQQATTAPATPQHPVGTPPDEKRPEVKKS